VEGQIAIRGLSSFTRIREKQMSDQKKEHTFSNETLEARCRFRPGCIVEADVSISPQAVQANYEKSIKEIRKQASLPGFRKGKIPKDILFKHFQDQIDRHARENLLSLGFKETFALIGRDPFSRQSVSKSVIKEYDLENGAELQFEYEARPQVPDIDIETLSLETVEPPSPSQEEIDEFYKRLQFMFSEKKEITDRVAQEGDLVTLTIIRPEEIDAEEREGQFHLVANMAPDWLINAVIGMELNSVKEAKIPSPDAGKPDLTVQISLHKIEECTIPEENDEFAQKAGAENLSQLREKIRDNLVLKAQSAAHERMRRQVKKELIRLYAFDLPQSIVERETEARFRPYWDAVSKNANNALDKDAVRKSFLDSVKRQFTCFFLLQPLFSSLQIPHSQEELMQELNYQMNEVPAPQCVLYPNLEEKEVVDRLLANIFVRHTIDHCIEKRLGLSPPGKKTAEAVD